MMQACSRKAELELNQNSELASDVWLETNALAGNIETVDMLAIPRVEVAGSTLRFLQMEGETSLTLAEQAPLETQITPMRQLLGQSLTALEIFKAVLPEAVRLAHQEETVLFCRGNQDVLDTNFELKLAPSAKSYASDNCERPFDPPPGNDYGDWE